MCSSPTDDHDMLNISISNDTAVVQGIPVTLSVKLPVASFPPVAVTQQVYVPPSLVEVVLTAKMCSL